MSKIEEIEGIGIEIGQILRANGVRTMRGLLKAAGNKRGRIELSKATGINESTLLQWVNKADLCRIKGISTQYSDLLKAAGVGSIDELQNKHALRLTKKMVEVNESSPKKLVRQLPVESQVDDWVKQAKELRTIVSH